MVWYTPAPHPLYLIVAYQKLALDEPVIGIGGLQGHMHHAILDLLVLLGGPENVARFLPLLIELAQGHHRLALELPHHSPQVIHCALKRALGGDVRIALLVALRRESEGK